MRTGLKPEAACLLSKGRMKACAGMALQRRPFLQFGPDGIRLDRKERAAAEWHPRTGLPDGLTDISIAYEMCYPQLVGTIQLSGGRRHVKKYIWSF